MCPMNERLAEITVFEKSGGPLTKRIALRDGKIINDSSSCRMANGFASRVPIESMQALADLINNFASNQAYVLGRLKDGVPDRVRVVRADKLNGARDSSLIARTQEFLIFNEGEPGLALLDADFKGMSEKARHRMKECGGLWSALCEVLPALETVAYVERASTSSGLRNKETGEIFAGSGGQHIVIPVLDAADIPRFLPDFHDRCWLAGLGWGMVSAAGSFLERSIVDKSCGSPERLIFEGAPIIEAPLEQIGRNASAHDGTILDTRLCRPPTDSEKAELQKLKEADERRLLPERERARSAWNLTHIERLIGRGIPESEAREQVERWIDHHELTGAFELPFDNRDLASGTVADVLADPDRFVNETMADPHEGPAYGRGKAILFRRPNGSLFIHSFAHGGMIYELKAAPKVGKRWIWEGEVRVEEARKWLVANLLPETGVALISGQWGAFKTFIALDLAVAVMTGGDFIKYPVMPRRGPVVRVRRAERGRDPRPGRIRGLRRRRQSTLRLAGGVTAVA
jgi:AAA domain